ncbi:Exocyst complex component SEC8-like protein, partial [Drosera capensis]
MGIFDGLPVPPDKSYLREDLARIDESWAAARFDSLPHVVQIVSSKDREGEVQALKEQSDIIEEVVDEVVHAYHGGFNKAIQNYSQILRLFSVSAESIGVLKTDLAEAKKRLGTRNKQLHQLWSRSVTLRHIISLLDQIEGIAKVPARIEKLIAEKQFYAAVQLHVQSALMLEREGLQMVGALQDVRSELTKLRGTLFYKVLEDLHAHLYNKGDYSSSDGLDESFSQGDELAVNGYASSVRTNGGDSGKTDTRSLSHQVPCWLSAATPDEFLEAVKKSDAALHVKYLHTMVECLCKLGKRLRPTIHEIITSEIKTHAKLVSLANPVNVHANSVATTLHFFKGQLENYHLSKYKNQNGTAISGATLAVSPVKPVMGPMGTAQSAAKELLSSILDTVVRVLENHVIVGELLESKASQQVDMNTPRSATPDVGWNADSEGSQVSGGYNIGFSLTVLQILLSKQPDLPARLLLKIRGKDGSEDGLTFAFRFADATISTPNQGVDLIRQGWSKKGSSMSQEGYGSAAVLPEQGIYLAAAVYRPVVQFSDKVASVLPEKYSQL